MLNIFSWHFQGIRLLAKTNKPLNCVFLPKFVMYGFVLHDSDPRHFLEHPLPAEPLETVDFQFGIPDVLQALWRYVYLLQWEWEKDSTKWRARGVYQRLLGKRGSSYVSGPKYLHNSGRGAVITFSFSPGARSIDTLQAKTCRFANIVHHSLYRDQQRQYRKRFS